MEILPEPYILLDPPELPEIPLPKGWTEYTLLAVLHVIALARIIVLNIANWPSDRECDGLRLRAENDRLKAEIDLLQREIEIKDARFSRIDPKKRPSYNALERFEILALKAIRGWSNEQMAKRFQISERSIRRWFRGSETQSGITQMPEVVTRYPDYVRMVVRRLKAFCPMLGRERSRSIAEAFGLDRSAPVGRLSVHKAQRPSEAGYSNGAEAPNASMADCRIMFGAAILRWFRLLKVWLSVSIPKRFRRSIRIAFTFSTSWTTSHGG